MPKRKVNTEENAAVENEAMKNTENEVSATAAEEISDTAAEETKAKTPVESEGTENGTMETEVLQSTMEDDENNTGEEAEDQKNASVARPDRRTLMVNRESTNAANDATRWHFYETAMFQNDYMRRPVFFGTLIAARRIRAGERTIWVGDIYHSNKQSGINGVVSIPYTEMLLNTENMSNAEAESRINAMMGSVVEFVITGVIRETDMIVGSRIKAMDILQRRYYISTGREHRPQVHAGRLVQARVMMVTPYSLTLDVFGVESRLNRQDVKWEWTAALTDDFAVGDLITVRVESVETTENGSLRISVTGKTGENPDLKNLKFAPVNSIQLGEVTSFANGIYFIRLFVGVNAVAHVVLGDKGCGVGDKVKLRITAYNRAQGTVTGKIVSVF